VPQPPILSNKDFAANTGLEQHRPVLRFAWRAIAGGAQGRAE
jgi:hypothetical protein